MTSRPATRNPRTPGAAIRKPTINDVANQSGVSRQTVSNVLNAPHRVKPDTREKVQQAIDDLGYRIHQSARRLRTQRSSTIGIRLDPDTDGISGAVLDRFLHALTELSSEQGLRILLFTAADPAEDIRQLSRLIDDGDVDAFVLTSTVHNDQRISWLTDQKFPFASFGRPWGYSKADAENIRWADVDGRLGTFHATNALLDAGFSAIGYLGWPAGSGTGDERAQGWYQAMASGSTAVPDFTNLLRNSDDDTQAAAQATRDLLKRTPDIDAIVCASDTLALGALLATAGTVPVVGFDDTPTAQALEMSSIRQPIREVAAALLAQLGHMEHSARQSPLFAPSIQWRGTLAHLKSR